MDEMSMPHASAEPADHAAHDHFLVAALADRTDDALDPDTAALAREQVASCPACAALYADLVALATAMPTSAVPPRPRDFTLTPADAERLRRGWRRWFGFFGSPRDAFSRPLALGLTTLGIAGLLVATVPSVLPIGAGTTSGVAAPSVGGAAEEMPFGDAQSAAPAAQPFATEVPAALGAAPSPPATEDLFAGQGSDTSGDGGGATSGDSTARENAVSPGEIDASVRDDASGLPTLAVVAGAMLIAGLGLFLLRWTGRRLSG
jgi:hypothetical protein